jgi:phage terminase small subunit
MSEKLTPKQEAFAQAVAGGQSYADAYRSAYSSKGKHQTVHTEGSKLANDPKVAHRIDMITGQKHRAIVRKAVTDRELVVGKLRRWTEDGIDPSTGEEPTPAQLQAAQLLGRTVALFTDKQVVEGTERSAEEVAAEIQRRLSDVQAVEGSSSDDNHPLH